MPRLPGSSHARSFDAGWLAKDSLPSVLMSARIARASSPAATHTSGTSELVSSACVPDLTYTHTATSFFGAGALCFVQFFLALGVFAFVWLLHFVCMYIRTYIFAACLACIGKGTITNHAWLYLIPAHIAEEPQCKSVSRAPFARSESRLSWPGQRMPNCFLLCHGCCVLRCGCRLPCEAGNVSASSSPHSCTVKHKSCLRPP